jgi:hypothetical protein
LFWLELLEKSESIKAEKFINMKVERTEIVKNYQKQEA